MAVTVSLRGTRPCRKFGDNGNLCLVDGHCNRWQIGDPFLLHWSQSYAKGSESLYQSNGSQATVSSKVSQNAFVWRHSQLHFAFGKPSLTDPIMTSLTREDIETYRDWHPAKWHPTKHDSKGFCTLMKTYYGGENLSLELKWLLANCDAPLSTDAMDTAASNGELNMVIWFHNNRFEGCTSAAMDRAATEGRLTVVKWLHDNRSEGCTAAAMNGAATNGHLDVVKWLHDNRTEGCTVTAMNNAARNGHLDVVMWLHLNRSEGCTVTAMDSAATNGHLSVVKWLHQNRSEGCTTAAMDGAVCNSHVDVARWLHDNRSEGCTTAAMDTAAGQGYLAAIKWLHSIHMEGTSAAMTNAAAKGFLDVVKYLHKNLELAATNTSIVAAAENGHLPVVEYLHRNRVENCQAEAIFRAKRNGHLDVVNLLLKHDECQLAVEVENRKVLAEHIVAIDQALHSFLKLVVSLLLFIPQVVAGCFLPRTSQTLQSDSGSQARTELEARIVAEEEANIRSKVQSIIRAEVEAEREKTSRAQKDAANNTTQQEEVTRSRGLGRESPRTLEQLKLESWRRIK